VSECNVKEVGKMLVTLNFSFYQVRTRTKSIYVKLRNINVEFDIQRTVHRDILTFRGPCIMIYSYNKSQ
jgi:hypothetical protein